MPPLRNRNHDFHSLVAASWGSHKADSDNDRHKTCAMHSMKVRAPIAHAAHPIATDGRHRNATWTGYKREQPTLCCRIQYYPDALPKAIRVMPNKRGKTDVLSNTRPHGINCCEQDMNNIRLHHGDLDPASTETQRGAGGKLAYYDITLHPFLPMVASVCSVCQPGCHGKRIDPRASR